MVTLPSANTTVEEFSKYFLKRSERFQPEGFGVSRLRSKSPQVPANGALRVASHMKNIVISGGNKGIGRATAEKFVASGARVFNLSRSPSGVASVIDIAIDLVDRYVKGVA